MKSLRKKFRAFMHKAHSGTIRTESKMRPVTPRRMAACAWLGTAFAMCVALALRAQPVSTTPAAVWITHPSAPANGPVVLRLRRDFDLIAVPKRLPIRVSADNRFVLYVNGERVGAGPARSDPAHWRYESYDIAPYLRNGHNYLSATVWNWGRIGPMAQMSVQTGFFLQADSDAQALVNSGTEWRVQIDPGHTANTSSFLRLIKEGWYYAAGPSEKIDAAKSNATWNNANDSGEAWQNAVPVPVKAANPSWQLAADPLPPMRFTPTTVGRVVRSDTDDAAEFPAKPLTVAAHQSVHLILDRGAVGAAYPKLTISGGAGARVRVVYAEALYDKNKRKGDRNEVGDRQAIGLEDTFLPDGSPARVFEPLWWRVWRYVEIAVDTAEQPLTLESFTAAETGYPFELKARFVSSDTALNDIWNIGWHTLEVDAHETFMDTAYWEQLQYVGDARIEALLAYTATADARLPLQAITAIRDSRTADGLTQSRYPSREPQSIPPFSLLWIGMLHDYWRYVPDRHSIVASLPTMRSALAWFAQYQLPNGLLGKVPEWNFVDWIAPGDRSFPSFAADGSSCVTSLIYLGALDEAADLETAVGDKRLARANRERGAQVRSAVREWCWDATRELFADTSEKKLYSQHVNTLAVLFDVVPKAQQAALMLKVAPPGASAAPSDLLPASYYFFFYVARAYAHAGLADRYPELLQPWRELLKLNFTTWPEEHEPTRSDTHAWSAHPTADLLGIVAGIQPAAPGFARVRIEPHLGSLQSLDAAMPTPTGLIEARYEISNGVLNAHLVLPRGLTGSLVWAGRTLPLRAGTNTFRLRAVDSRDRH